MWKNTVIMRSICLFIASFFLLTNVSVRANPIHISKAQWEHATNAVVRKYEPMVDAALEPYFKQANLTYPPRRIALLTFKQEKVIELWAKNSKTEWRFIRTYPLTAFSGNPGPKLQMNDSQIPEGIYKITELNPYSSQHLSMMLNYPNEFDRVHAKEDGRTNLGNNIFIHGKNLSVGCLAIGDNAIDQLFVLVKRVGPSNTTIIIAPNDLRKERPVTKLSTQPKWVPQLYDQIYRKLVAFKNSHRIVA